MSLIALEPKHPARAQAVFAIAAIRTPESIATLKRLLNDADPQIREYAALAVKNGLVFKGKREEPVLKREDFSAEELKQAGVE